MNATKIQQIPVFIGYATSESQVQAKDLTTRLKTAKVQATLDHTNRTKEEFLQSAKIRGFLLAAWVQEETKVLTGRVALYPNCWKSYSSSAQAALSLIASQSCNALPQFVMLT